MLNKYDHLAERLEISPKTILLRKGEIAKHTYYLEKGCVRVWFDHNGKNVTLNFFFEGDGVSSVDSFRNGTPSVYGIESIETCIIYKISKENFEYIMKESASFNKRVEEETFKHLNQYQRLFLSRIKDRPEERYKDLLKNEPEIIKRVPQHYIASYLGVSPVSLSRIRKRP
jgi:CRP-like cAMP-binding protein